MNGVRAARSELRALANTPPPSSVDVVVCPPATLLTLAGEDLAETAIFLGAQDCSPHEHGAYTGQISAEMIKDAGAAYVIVGHSEVRKRGERSADVRAKAIAAMRHGIIPVICVGENATQRADDWTAPAVRAQVLASLPPIPDWDKEHLVIAYEPIWAIGSGQTPTMEEIAAVHKVVRETVVELYGETIGQGVRIAYGGSVAGKNAGQIFALDDVDGVLVGGASLKADSFAAVIDAVAE